MTPVARTWETLGAWAPVGKIVVVVLGGAALDLGARIAARRIVVGVGPAESDALSVRERAQRAATLVNVAASLARVGIWLAVVLTVLSELTIDVGPFLAGAGVLGAALAFGAQNVVKDYLAGFFILFEEQYAIGDVVRIGQVSGTVERISMRSTVLRGIDGARHVVAHGSIQMVTNLTSTWARAVVEVPVAATADVDAAIAALAEAARATHADGEFAKLFLEAPVVAGVVAMGETTLTLRAQAKVLPGEQWRVQREILRRTKLAFDASFVTLAPPGRSVQPPSPAVAGPDTGGQHE